MSVTENCALVFSRTQVIHRCVSLLLFMVSYFCAQGQTTADQYYQRSYHPPRYLILPDSGYLVHHVTGSRESEAAPAAYATQGVPGARAADIEFYNLLLPGPQIMALMPNANRTSISSTADTLLVTFAVLPFKNGTITWEPIAPDTVRGFQYTLPEFVQEANERIERYRQAGSPGRGASLYRSDIRLIVRRHGQYWSPQPFILTGYFVIHTQKDNVFTKSDLATINIHKKIFPKDKLMRKYYEKYSYGLRKYTAGNILIDKKDRKYDFWLSPNVINSQPSVVDFGYDNFRYQPGIGIISGTLESYFTGGGVPSFRFFDVMSIDGKRIQ